MSTQTDKGIIREYVLDEMTELAQHMDKLRLFERQAGSAVQAGTSHEKGTTLGDLYYNAYFSVLATIGVGTNTSELREVGGRVHETNVEFRQAGF